MEIKIALADNSEIYRNGIASVLKRYPEIKISFEAINGAELLVKLNRSKVDVILLSLQITEISSLETLKEIRERDRDIKVIILSTSGNKIDIVNSFKAGANGFILKETDPSEFYKAILTCVRKGNYYNDMTNAIFIDILNSQKSSNSIESGLTLTETEMQVVVLICQGKTTIEIAKALGKGVYTLDKIRMNIRKKTSTKNPAELIDYAIKNKLINNNLC